MKFRWIAPLVSAFAILGAALYLELIGGALAAAAALFLLLAAAVGFYRDRRVIHSYASSLPEIYDWLLRYGDPEMVVTISRKISEQPTETTLWAIAQVEKTQRERLSPLRIEFTVNRRRSAAGDLRMLRLWLFARSRLRLAAASFFLSGMAYMSADELSARQLAILTDPLLTAFDRRAETPAPIGPVSATRENPDADGAEQNSGGAIDSHPSEPEVALAASAISPSVVLSSKKG